MRSGSGDDPRFTYSMPRNQGPFTPDDDAQFYRGRDEDQGGASARRATGSGLDDEALDDRVVDLDREEQSPFLRAQKRVPVRRGGIPRKTANRLRIVLIVLSILTVAGGIGGWLYSYGTHSWRFRVESSDSIEVHGAKHVSRSQVMQIMAPDLSRNIFFVPLEQRKKQIEELPWVESATVMRLLPGRIKVHIRERTPVAFVMIGSRVELIDANGVVMSASPRSQAEYSFPVILGSSESDPLSTRAARMKIYQRLMQELDSTGARYSQDVNEVDLSDPEDVKITVADSVGAVVIHLGNSNFVDRYKVWISHAQEWRQQYPKLSSVDLRYDQQVVVTPDLGGAVPEMPAVAPKKTSAPVKPVAKRKPAATPKKTTTTKKR